MTSPNPQLIHDALMAQGFSHFGFAKLTRPLSIDFYRDWLDQGHHGSMEYLARHLPQKEDPSLLLAKAQTAIVVAAPYPRDEKRVPFKGLKIAGYAQGEDYHVWLKEKLEGVIRALKEAWPDENFVAATDSAPVLERDLAYRAGIGWFGKNTCLIDQRRGSFFLIGEILTTASWPIAEAIHPDRCGTCSRCTEACPTQALTKERTLDARRCISYLTIEAKDNPPKELRSAIGDHFFGCDICQTVCPWNRKAFGSEYGLTAITHSDSLTSDLRFILSSSKRELERAVENSPLARARGRGLKRNAMLVIANLKLKEFLPDIKRYVHDDDAVLSEIAQWAIQSLDP